MFLNQDSVGLGFLTNVLSYICHRYSTLSGASTGGHKVKLSIQASRPSS